jgi:hypothetical protein
MATDAQGSDLKVGDSVQLSVPVGYTGAQHSTVGMIVAIPEPTSASQNIRVALLTPQASQLDAVVSGTSHIDAQLQLAWINSDDCVYTCSFVLLEVTQPTSEEAR